MRRIFLKWMMYSIGISLIPVVILGASPGGIALSPIILVVGLFIGLVGASIHLCIFAFRSGNREQKWYSAAFTLASISFLSWQIYVESQCTLIEDDAYSSVVNFHQRFGGFELSDLATPVFSEDECTFTYTVTGKSEYKTIYVDEWLKIYFVSK